MMDNIYSVKYEIGDPENPEIKSRHKKIMALANTFSEISEDFKINLAVDIRGGQAGYGRGEDALKEKDTIHIHVDSYPPRHVASKTIRVSTIFGLAPEEMISIKLPSEEPSPMVKPIIKTAIVSPERETVGCIVQNHIYIYPEVLTDTSWSDENRADILKSICLWSIPKALKNIDPEKSHFKIRQGLLAMRERSRKLFFVREETRNDLRKKVGSFMFEFNVESIKEIESKINSLEEKIRDLSKSYFDALNVIVLNRQKIEAAKSEVKNRNFGDEFEAILIMESVETVRIIDGRYVQIKTSPISQVPEVNSRGEGEGYDIGEFVIIIDTMPQTNQTSLSKSNIRFRQDESHYNGAYKHKYVLIQNHVGETCFGGFLNPLLSGLMSRFNIVPATHLILSFMKKESTKPDYRGLERNAIEPNRDYYKTDEERESEKKKFIELVSSTVLNLSIDSLEQESELLNLRAESNHRDFLSAKLQVENYELIFDHLTLSERTINSEINKLFDDRSVYRIDVSHEALRIFFHCYEETPENHRLIDNFILEIKPNLFPELLISTNKKTLQSIPLINIDESKNYLRGIDEKLIENLHFGLISEVLNMAKNRIITNMYDPKRKNSTTEESNEE